MSTTLTIDSAGGLFLPGDLLQEARFEGGGKVVVEVTADRIVLSPAIEEARVKVVNRGRLLVIEGLPCGSDVVAAIKADRDERDARTARAVLGK